MQRADLAKPSLHLPLALWARGVTLLNRVALAGLLAALTCSLPSRVRCTSHFSPASTEFLVPSGKLGSSFNLFSIFFIYAFSILFGLCLPRRAPSCILHLPMGGSSKPKRPIPSLYVWVFLEAACPAPTSSLVQEAFPYAAGCKEWIISSG